MKAVQISGQWYIIRDDENSERGFVVVDGPFPEEWQAVSFCRLRECD